MIDRLDRLIKINKICKLLNINESRFLPLEETLLPITKKPLKRKDKLSVCLTLSTKRSKPQHRQDLSISLSKKLMMFLSMSC